MGVVNVTPDSFSDGGRWFDADAAIAHGLELVAEGADILDVGGESTRPGAARVEPDEELRRVVPVVRELAGARHPGQRRHHARGHRRSPPSRRAPRSSTTSRPGSPTPRWRRSWPRRACTTWRCTGAGTPTAWTRSPSTATWRPRCATSSRPASTRSSPRASATERIILDPGLGFAKRGAQNWELLGRLDVLAELGLPILVGASRKRFLGALLPDDAAVEERDLPTAVISALSAQAGAWGVRVHDVRGTRRALDVLGAWQSGRRG